MTTRHTAAEQRFIERMGQQAQADGIPKIAGQIWAVLVLADEPLSSADLMELLQISKGSVSTNSRLLEMLHIVERRSRPGERKDYFAIRDNPYSALIAGQIKRFESAQAIVTDAKHSIENARALAKLRDLERFYKLYHESSIALFDALQDESSANRKPG